MNHLESILSLAREQIGMTENPPGSNNVIYNTDYYGGPVCGPQYPWCCAFIWWLFDRCGLSGIFCGGEKTAYCPYVVSWARAHGQWVTGGYITGDLLLYDWDGDGVADHIGICEENTGGTLSAIEGNCGDAVQRVARWTGSVMGAYRPEYGEALPQSAPPTAPAEREPAGDIPDTYTVQAGDMLGIIAMRYGTTIRELARINHIENVGLIYPGQVLRLRETVPADPESEMDTEPERITALAMDVIAGKYGNGLARRLRLGKDYDKVQTEVNRLMSGR